jgi:hypothetical protein
LGWHACFATDRVLPLTTALHSETVLRLSVEEKLSVEENPKEEDWAFCYRTLSCFQKYAVNLFIFVHEIN